MKCSIAIKSMSDIKTIKKGLHFFTEKHINNNK